MSWIEDYGAALADRHGRALSGLHLSAAEEERILDLARIVAHRSERKNAPLAAYLAGYFAAVGGSGGGLEEAVAVAAALLPPAEETAAD